MLHAPCELMLLHMHMRRHRHGSADMHTAVRLAAVRLGAKR